MKRKMIYLALMMVMIVSVLFITGCGNPSELAGKASIADKEQTTEQDEGNDQKAAVQNTGEKSDISTLITDIDELDVITLESDSQLESIRNRYEGLSDKDKKLIKNYEKLTKAEDEYQSLRDEESRLNYTVWQTKTGSCYHIEGCYHLRTKYESMTQKEAIDRGLEPCDDCITAYWIPRYWYDRNSRD